MANSSHALRGGILAGSGFFGAPCRLLPGGTGFAGNGVMSRFICWFGTRTISIVSSAVTAAVVVAQISAASMMRNRVNLQQCGLQTGDASAIRFMKTHYENQ
jgi:hypothetical protein